MLQQSDLNQRWIILLAQLPAAPSSARVALWRRMRAAGAASLLNGAWALPNDTASNDLFRQLAETVRGQGGHALVFAGDAVEGGDQAIIERFDADRARDYAEFAERCDGLLAEIAKETEVEKFTFAELDEVEHDHDKLTSWLAKIEARDFHPGERREAARERLRTCEQALHAFAAAVYEREGLAER